MYKHYFEILSIVHKNVSERVYLSQNLIHQHQEVKLNMSYFLLFSFYMTLFMTCRMYKTLAEDKLLSLRAVYVPEHLNLGADILSNQDLRPEGLYLNVVELILQRYDRAEVDFFVSAESTHCPLWFALTPPAALGLDAMVLTWQILHLYVFSPIALFQQKYANEYAWYS